MQRRKHLCFRCRPESQRRIKSRNQLALFVSCDSSGRSQLPARASKHAVYTSFVRVMGQTGALALTSKILGLIREQVISRSFGLGGVADAFSITSAIPLLALSGIGGLNGALHCAMASTCKQIIPNTCVSVLNG